MNRSRNYQVFLLSTSLCLLILVGCEKDSKLLKTGKSLQGQNKDETVTSYSETNSVSSNGKVFQRLHSKTTGIDFTIKWDKPDSYNRIFFSQNTGGGVALGDFDGDGRCDIYLTRPSYGNRLYRNLGNFQFKDVTQQAGLKDDAHWGTGASFVDIDNDGDLDLYACGYACRNKLYINQGDGRFIERAKQHGLDFNGASVTMAFADYDRDGDLDGYLVTAGLPPGPNQKFRVRFVNGRPEVIERLQEHWKLLYLPGDRAKQVEAGQFDHLFRNDGPGSDGTVRFVDVSKQAGVHSPDIGQAATWWDYNADDYPDLYVSNDYWGSDKLYRNNQDGTFTDVAPEALPHTPWSSMGADIADINSDGRIDLMATDMAGSSHFKQKLGMGDMSSSGWFLEYGRPRQYPRNAVFLNTGTDRFMEVAFLTGLASSDWTWTPRFEDFDNDGRVDVFITNGMTRDFTNSDLNEVAKKQAKEGTPEFFRFWREQGYRADRNMIFKNHGDLEFEDVSKEWGFDRLGVSFGAATGDLDGDGDLDLVVNNMDIPAAVYQNISESGNSLSIRLQGTTSNRQGLGAVVKIQTGDQKQIRYFTLSRGWTSSSEPIVHFGLGKFEHAELVTIHWPSGIVQHLENLAANQVHEIKEPAMAKSSSKAVANTETLFHKSNDFAALKLSHREVPFDDFQRQPLLPNKLSQMGPGLACGDINGDGRDDLYLAGAKGQAGQLIVSTAGGNYRKKLQSSFVIDRNYEDMGALFFDADGDGDLDLYVVSGGAECAPQSQELQDRLYINNGSGNFMSAPGGALPTNHFSGSVVAAADFDRDGDLDLFVGGRVIPGKYPLTPQSALYRNDHGKFTDVTQELAPKLISTGMVTSAVWSDADNDGWLDLLVTHEWGPVKFFQNREGTLVDQTAAAKLADRLGWWNGIAAADIDNDGDIDYAVTNFGLNTKYHADLSHPAKIYYGDFDNSGTMRIVESEYEGDKLFPIRGKSCSSNAMPFLTKKFTTFESFAVAQLDDIYTEKCLQEAHQFAANTLESGVLMNDGSGRFKFLPWPRLAQVAPGFGVICTDVDGDNKIDIYVAQNFYGPQRETGRMDGGVSLLLLGNGDGTFRPIMPSTSGLIAPGDSMSLSMIDINGDNILDFVTGVNDGLALAFENRSLQPEQTLTVRLQGEPGNPTAIGSRITIHLERGSLQSSEVYAGGGYLSQSSSDLSFSLSNVDALQNKIKKINVRWPDGTTSSHAPSVISGLLLLNKPKVSVKKLADDRTL